MLPLFFPQPSSFSVDCSTVHPLLRIERSQQANEDVTLV